LDNNTKDEVSENKEGGGSNGGGHLGHSGHLQLNNHLNVSDPSAQSALPDGTDMIQKDKDPDMVNNDDGSGQPLTPTSTEGQSISVKSESEVARQGFGAEEARRIFDKLVLKNAEANPSMEKGVFEQEYRETLISSGFNLGDINARIKAMENDKVIERVGTESDGIMCDILKVIN